MPAKDKDVSSAESAPAATIEITRSEEAQRIISKYTGWGAGSGVVPVPGLDVLAVGAVQVLMVRDLLELYGKPFSESRTRTIVTILIGSLSPSTLAGATAITLFKFVPVIGAPLAMMAMPILASAATYAVGRVVASHLEEGGNLNNFDPKAVKTRLRDAFEEGKERLKSAVGGSSKSATTA